MPTTTTSAVRQLSDGNPQGTAFGQSATDLIGFYTSTAAGLGNSGAQPVVQPSGGMTAVTRGMAGGVVMIFSSSQSPSGVTTLTSAEYSITVQNGTKSDTYTGRQARYSDCAVAMPHIMLWTPCRGQNVTIAAIQ